MFKQQQHLGPRFGTSRMYFRRLSVLRWIFCCCWFVAPIMGVMRLFNVLFYRVLCLSSIAIILMGKVDLVALLCLPSWFFVTVDVLWLFLAVPWIGLQCVIMVFPHHTHLLFLVYHLDIVSPFFFKDVLWVYKRTKIHCCGYINEPKYITYTY